MRVARRRFTRDVGSGPPPFDFSSMCTPSTPLAFPTGYFNSLTRPPTNPFSDPRDPVESLLVIRTTDSPEHACSCAEPAGDEPREYVNESSLLLPFRCVPGPRQNLRPAVPVPIPEPAGSFLSSGSRECVVDVGLGGWSRWICMCT